MGIRAAVNLYPGFLRKAGEGASLTTYGAAVAAGDHLRSTTADPAKGSWYRGGSEWNEATNCLGIGCFDPQYGLDLGPAATMRFRGLVGGILQVDALGVVSLYVAPTAPAAPTNLVLSGITSSAITLTWTDNSSNETGFRVERSTDNFVSSIVAVTTTAAGVLTYTDSGLNPSTLYYYRVKATNSAGDSANSNVASATTLAIAGAPGAPTNLTLSAITATSITLNWTDNSSDEDGFKLERGTDGTTFAQVGTTAANATSATDGGLSSSTPYYYRVRAYNANGNSAYTNTASATTLAPSGGVTDNFKGTDLTNLTAHTADTGQTWTVVRGGWQIRDGAAGYVNQNANSTGLSIAWIGGQGADGTVQCGFTSQSPSTYPYNSLQNGLCFRYDAASDKCICLLAASVTTYQLLEFDGITPGTVLATFGVPAIGDIVKVTMAGNVWNVWLSTAANPMFVQVVTNVSYSQSWTATGHHGLANTWNNAFTQPEWFGWQYSP